MVSIKPRPIQIVEVESALKWRGQYWSSLSGADDILGTHRCPDEMQSSSFSCRLSPLHRPQVLRAWGI